MPELINNNTEDAKGRKDQGSLLTGLRHPLASLLAAIRFLTILPVSYQSKKDGRYFQASLLWFPLVGLLTGAAVSLVAALSVQVMPMTLAAVGVMLLLALVSGGLHLDGLADSGDGLFCARSRERALEIMRDSHSGPMGMLLLIFVLLAKYAALSSLPKNVLPQVVLFMPMAGRLAILVTMAILPYARSGDGLGALFYSRDRHKVAGLALFFFLLVLLSLATVQIVFALILALVCCVGGFSLICYRKFGGATGDTLGAVCELCELAVAISFAVIFFTE